MQDIRKSPEYQRWRREVKHRDENTCRVCTVQRNLHVHHIKPLEKYPEFATDLDNGITLCGNCHAFLSGKEENTNLQTIIEAFTDQQDMRTAQQLKRLNNKFSAYLEDLLKSEDQGTVNDAVHKMFVHLQIYPDSLDQFLYLIEYILSSEKGFENQFAGQIAIEILKNHPSKTASEMLSKYEISWNYQDGKRAHLLGDYATALKKFEPLAESGHTESQHYLGLIYEEGRGVVKDVTAAIKWYLKAAQQGNKEARTRLERIYEKREDTRERDEDALPETSLTRQRFFQNLSLTGINLCLSALETYDVRIEIKDGRFTLLDIERSSGSPMLGSSGMSAPLHTIFSEAYSQLSGEVFLTQEDIPTLKAFLASIKADVFVNLPTVRARVKEKLDMAEQIFHEARREYMKLRVELWSEEIELWCDELELESDKWDRKALSRKVSDREIIDYLRRDLLSGESNGTHSFEDVIYGYRQEIDKFFEALYRLEERTRIENTWQPKEESELKELLRESGWSHVDDTEVQKLVSTKQIGKLNEHPINQRALEILNEAGVAQTFSPQLHIVELMEWVEEMEKLKTELEEAISRNWNILWFSNRDSVSIMRGVMYDRWVRTTPPEAVLLENLELLRIETNKDLITFLEQRQQKMDFEYPLTIEEAAKEIPHTEHPGYEELEKLRRAMLAYWQTEGKPEPPEYEIFTALLVAHGLLPLSPEPPQYEELTELLKEKRETPSYVENQFLLWSWNLRNIKDCAMYDPIEVMRRLQGKDLDPESADRQDIQDRMTLFLTETQDKLVDTMFLLLEFIQLIH